ncbi:hypothetical protein FA15DRAFT_385250 [Coprinopsis marcescibilis]|uniref:Uncharacterized protein n=1 Tax=Coprinopsis marcescibilis TaxID=230819 RepID=A0A5C3K9V9_COPMA|nr:hypothetical protein FA15DRAFT_385250 [Coprinopsis marcescibilis]
MTSNPPPGYRSMDHLVGLPVPPHLIERLIASENIEDDPELAPYKDLKESLAAPSANQPPAYSGSHFNAHQGPQLFVGGISDRAHPGVTARPISEVYNYPQAQSPPFLTTTHHQAFPSHTQYHHQVFPSHTQYHQQPGYSPDYWQQNSHGQPSIQERRVSDPPRVNPFELSLGHGGLTDTRGQPLNYMPNFTVRGGTFVNIGGGSMFQGNSVGGPPLAHIPDPYLDIVRIGNSLVRRH